MPYALAKILSRSEDYTLKSIRTSDGKWLLQVSFSCEINALLFDKEGSFIDSAKFIVEIPEKCKYPFNLQTWCGQLIRVHMIKIDKDTNQEKAIDAKPVQCAATLA